MQHWLKGDPPVAVILRRSARARRFSLRVSRLDARVTLSIPAHAREADALAFAEGHRDWIRKALTQAPARVCVTAGVQLPFEGQVLTLTEADVRAPMVLGDRLLVPAGADRVAVRAQAFLKLQARHRLQAASDHYAGLVGRRHAGITLRDTRSRWGSCAPDGSLMYSWRLIMAPPQVLDYVAAHEVAHLVEMNHSADFWAVVARLMPDYAVHRRWLKRQGNQLHGFDFAGARGG